jgi:lipopolysaccharide export system protein LptA
MLFLIRLLFATILVYTSLFAQVSSEKIIVIGDSLVGKVISGAPVREVYGNVNLRQGNILVTCDKAIQYIKSNNALLSGNVIAKQDSITIITSEGFYFGNDRKTKSIAGITLDDQKVILKADSGEYFFDEDKAFFQTNVTLFDTLTTLSSNELTYYQKEDRAVAVGRVKIIDVSNEISADTIEHFRNSKISFADGNVKIKSLKNKTLIFGDHLEDYPEKKYTVITENPLLLQIDTTYTGGGAFEIDSLVIEAEMMEAFRDTSNTFKAVDSVKIVKGEFASVNDFTIYLRSSDIIITEKISDNSRQPILWYENSQLTGDSIAIYLVDNKIERLDVVNNAFMLSQNQNYLERFDQTSSNNIKLFFLDNKIQKAKFIGTVFSIYYLYEEELANGLSKSSAMDATIIFVENEVSEVRLYGSPVSEYYPEKKIIGNEKAFTLPKFVFYTNRPVKEQLLESKQKNNGNNIRKQRFN